MRPDFPDDLDRPRARLESVIAAVKRQLSARVPGRPLLTQGLQALRRGIAYNLYRLQCRARIQLQSMSTELDDF